MASPHGRPPRPGRSRRPPACAAVLLGTTLDLWDVPNRLLDAHAGLVDSGAFAPPTRAIFADIAAKLNLSERLLGWRP